MDSSPTGKEQNGNTQPRNESSGIVDGRLVDSKPLGSCQLLVDSFDAATYRTAEPAVMVDGSNDVISGSLRSSSSSNLSQQHCDERCHQATENQLFPAENPVRSENSSRLAVYSPRPAGLFRARQMHFHGDSEGLLNIISRSRTNLFADNMTFGGPSPVAQRTAASNDHVDYADVGASNPGDFDLNDLQRYARKVSDTVDKIAADVQEIKCSQNAQKDITNSAHERTKTDISGVKSAQKATDREVRAMAKDISGLDSKQKAMAEDLAKLRLSQEDERRQGDRRMEMVLKDTGETKQMLMSALLQQQPDSGNTEKTVDSVSADRLRRHSEVLERKIMAKKVAAYLLSRNKLSTDAYQRIFKAHTDGLFDEAGHLLLMNVLQGSVDCHESFIEALNETGQSDLFYLLTQAGVVIEESHALIIKNNWQRLVENMYVDEDFCVRLHEVLEYDERQIVTAGLGGNNKVERLLMLLCRKSSDCYQKFLQALLQTGQQHIINILKRPLHD